MILEFNRANPSPPKDLLDVLLSASEESHRDVLITDDNIKAVLVVRTSTEFLL